MRLIRNIFALAIVTVALLSASNAFAQCPDLPPIDTIVTCTFVNGVKVITPVSQPPSNASSGGQAFFKVVGHNFNPCEALLQPLEFFSQGQSPTLGPVNSSLGQNSPLSSIKGTNSATLFPGAQLTLNFNLNVSTPSLPPLTSVQPLVLKGTINSIKALSAPLTQSGSVQLRGPQGAIRATLTGTQVVLNRQGD